MVGIGIGEMILIAGIALVVFGPEKFPDFAKIVLRTVRDLRGYVEEIQREVSKEIKPIKRELDQMSKYDPEKYIDALSKDNTTEKKDDPVKADATGKAAADPTDRQDDSFDYDYNAGDNAEPDPYGIHKEDSGTDGAPDTETEPAPQPEQTRETGGDSNNGDNGNDGEKDDMDFSQPPVERLD